MERNGMGKLHEWVREAEANGHRMLGWAERDSQRSRVYRSEWPLMHGRPVLGEAGIQALVKKVENSPYVIKNFGMVTHKVSMKREGARTSHAFRNGTLHFSPRACDYTVIHELAHSYAVRDNGGHGWLFCATVLDLARHFLGQEFHDALKQSFKNNNVRFTVPRAKRQMTAEQREAAAQRLAAARETRLGAKVEPHAFVMEGVDWNGERNGRWFAVQSVNGHRVNVTTVLRSYYQSSSNYLVRSSEKGIATMFAKLDKIAPERVRAIPVSKLPDESYIPEDWSPDA